MAHDPRLGETVEVRQGSITITWTNIGSVQLRGNRFRYEVPPECCGVYRIRQNLNGEQVASYIGHSVDVRRRIPEDIREHAAQVRATLEAGGNVRVDLADVTWGEEGGPEFQVLKDGEFARLLVEGAALAFDSTEQGIINRARHRP